MEKIYSLRYRLLLFFVFLSNWVFAQTGTITGQIVDEKNLPLPGATVIVKGTTLSTSADVNGYFKITGVPAGTQTITASFIGYTPLEKQATANGAAVNFQLQPSSVALNEVAVIGYGTVRKSDATGSLSVVTAKDFNRGAVNSIQEAIVGKLPGVVITSNSGAPGNTSTIRIRGGASLNASSDPLLVVDNVPLDNTGLGGSANLLATINPDDIENITVLKDASATAIYGARASNGVLQITTKRGTKQTQLRYNVTTSLAVLPKYVDNYTGDEFRDVVNRVYGGTTAITSMLGDANTNWQDEIYRKAFGQDHNLSLSGTAKSLPYRVSLGYNNTDGVLKTYNFSRTTLAVGLDPSLFNKTLNIHINLKGLYNTNNFAEQAAIGNAVSFDPSQPVYNGNTRWRGYTTWTTDGDLNGPPVTLATANPVAQLELTDNKSTVRRTTNNIQFDYKVPFLTDLHANLNLGYDYGKSFGHNNAPDNTSWVYVPVVAGGRISNYNESTTNQLLDFYLNYRKDLKSIESSIDVTAGYSYSYFKKEGHSTSSDVAMTTPQPPNDFITDYVLKSYFGRLNYSLQDKYLLTFTMRADATSRWAPENRWGYFPAGAVTWKLKEEDFLKSSDVVSDLKLRVGYGITGQQNLGDGNNYPYLAKFTIGDQTSQYQFGDIFYRTIRPDGYDSNIRWETTTTTNVGLDYGFFNGRLSGSLDLYWRKTKDLLSYLNAPAGTNFSAMILTNVGNMNNHGVELGLNAVIVSKKDFNWQLGYNISYNQNKITNLSLNNDNSVYVSTGATIAGTFDNIQFHKVGYSRASYKVYQQIYDENGKPVEDAYVDRNGDNIINSDDMYYYQKPDPTVLMGINSRVNYKRFDFSFSGRLSLGNYNYNNAASGSTYKGLYSSLGYLANQTKAAEETQFVNALKTNMSDYYIQNASFFRMDNINLGYNFPNINKLKLRLNAGVQNVFVITKYKGLDPEISGGLDNNFFPRARIFQLGLNCTF
ncbi:SusC/RagA family TonB-linked outer membrane protein [Mucilaginibacter limnophilus]|uniref:SusC/RagA family TonB-linked outer membrane protein n=1 Tax=Mucilaginibacter limnophilus TaxID=1932778 RepID=A0A3S2Y672_9SPHI|nr:SusC/RagA family TonB-linked outer membrane protein [Mucilaginibacter limnophilus]RVU03053.1 SusC/RagA family TonB-linked outer membrane protein [Mucilaginibacter limnophilus]